MAEENQRGLLLIVSGPSGSGKSTLVQEVVRSGEFPIVFSVSATSRPPRPGEEDGVHYRFLSRQRFEEMSRRGDFLEHALVHEEWYGTPRAPVESALAQGRWVLLEIDVNGHRQVKRARPDAVSVFVRAPSLEEYEERLRGRGTESDQAIARRLSNAKEELLAAREYDYQLVNESIPQAVRTLRTLLRGIRVLRGETHVG